MLVVVNIISQKNALYFQYKPILFLLQYSLFKPTSMSLLMLVLFPGMPFALVTIIQVSPKVLFLLCSMLLRMTFLLLELP